MSSDAELSREIAREAGELLLDVRRSFGDIDPQDRERGRLLRDTADREAHLHIERRLADARPDDTLLSEEGDDDPARLEADRLWIVDPLDGTWEYGQGRDDFAVHVALWQRDGSLSAATVDLPSSARTWSVLDDDRAPTSLPADRPVRVVVSRSRRPVGVDDLVDGLNAELGVDVDVVTVGSVGAKVGELLAGRAEVYVHDSGFHDWDLAAPLAVARHQGFWCSTPSGEPFSFNGRSLVQPGVVMAAPAVASAVARLLGLA
ncbi:MAG TPA: inositol monophosphatase family protein [Candidatus Nanopelagicales bacterium]|nr:inositol monophosphatase family protein [Candidatus Nanopelagicales bacterium]